MNASKARKLEGIIVSNKPDKTAIVSVKSLKAHKKYKKRFLIHKKFAAHDPNNDCRIGDKVQIIESAPVSKRKRWKIWKIIAKGLDANIAKDISLDSEARENIGDITKEEKE